MALEVEEEAVVSPLVALLSLICHQTSVHLCTLDQVSIQCCLQGVWEVQEEEGHPTLGLVFLHNSSMDRVVIHSTAHRYLVVEVQEGLHMALYLRWEEAWVQG